jgi:integrase
MTLALCTTMRGVEIKNLHWQDVDLLRRSFTVRRSKADAGLRSIPMNNDAYDAVLELWERAKALSATEPEHFLFPACEHGQIDPERCQKSWRTAWRKLTQAAGLKGFRFHECRHHGITELAESQARDATIMALAGHVSRKMLEHYSHVRQEAMRDAVNWIELPHNLPKAYDLTLKTYVGIEPTTSSMPFPRANEYGQTQRNTDRHR